MAPVEMYQQLSLREEQPSSLVEQQAGLVKRIAYHLMARLPDTVDVDDLIQEGMIGLLEAAKSFEVNQGAKFETYAGIRIRGAMLDQVRRNNWAPRSVHRQSREISNTIKALEQRLGRQALDIEISEAMGLEIGEYHQMLAHANGQQLFSLDELSDSDQSSAKPISENELNPEQSVHRDNFQLALSEAIKTLPEREGLIMSLYYNDELNLKEIGEVLNISESRVSQIHTQTILRLRSQLSDWLT